jgi:asparagine synthase (glutamine-hydrolysing)
LAFILNQSDQADLISYYLTVETPYKDPLLIFQKEFSQKLKGNLWNIDYRETLSRCGSRSLIEKQLLVDFDILLTNRYLEKVDKATMLSSVEARVPYLDNDLVDFAISLPCHYKIKNNTGKYILKKALEDYLPKEILYRQKRGFDVPYRHWLRNDLYSFAMDVVKSQDNNIINHDVFEKRMNEHKNFKADYGDLLWKMVVLCTWMNLYKSKIST